MLIKVDTFVWILIIKQVKRKYINIIYQKSSVLSFRALSIYHLPHFIWQMSRCGPSFGSGNCHCLYELNKRNIINRMYAIPLLCTYVNCVLLLSKILFPIFVYTKQEKKKRSISRREPSLACRRNNGWY